MCEVHDSSIDYMSLPFLVMEAGPGLGSDAPHHTPRTHVCGSGGLRLSRPRHSIVPTVVLSRVAVVPDSVAICTVAHAHAVTVVASEWTHPRCATCVLQTL